MKLKGERVASDLLKELSMILLTDAKDEDFKKNKRYWGFKSRKS